MAERTVVGHAINGDDMHYIAECPHCGYEIEWKGFFDSTDKHNCPKCHQRFYVNKIWINDNEYIN